MPQQKTKLEIMILENGWEVNRRFQPHTIEYQKGTERLLYDFKLDKIVRTYAIKEEKV